MIIFARQIPSSYLLQVKTTTTTNYARNHIRTSLFFVLIQRYYVLALLCLDAKILHSCGYGLSWEVCMEKKCSTIMPNLLCLLLQFLYSIMFLATSQGATVCHETKGTRDGRLTTQFFSINLLDLLFHSFDEIVGQKTRAKGVPCYSNSLQQGHFEHGK